MDGVRVRNRKHIAVIIHDEKCDGYLIMPKIKGFGPVVFDEDLETAKTRYSEGLKLTAAVNNLIYFSDIATADIKHIRELSSTIDPVESAVNFSGPQRIAS